MYVCMRVCETHTHVTTRDCDQASSSSSNAIYGDILLYVSIISLHFLVLSLVVSLFIVTLLAVMFRSRYGTIRASAKRSRAHHGVRTIERLPATRPMSNKSLLQAEGPTDAFSLAESFSAPSLELRKAIATSPCLGRRRKASLGPVPMAPAFRQHCINTTDTSCYRLPTIPNPLCTLPQSHPSSDCCCAARGSTSCHNLSMDTLPKSLAVFAKINYEELYLCQKCRTLPCTAGRCTGKQSSYTQQGARGKMMSTRDQKHGHSGLLRLRMSRDDTCAPSTAVCLLHKHWMPC